MRSSSSRLLSTRLLRTSVLALLIILTAVGCQRSHTPSASYEYAAQGLYSATWSADAQHAIVGSINHGGSLWEWQNNARLYNWNHKANDYAQITSSAFSPEGQYAITATPQTMVLWSTSSGESDSFWTAPSEILDIKLLPNGNYALLGLADHSAAIFDVRRGGVKQVYYHDGRVNSVDYNNNDRSLLLSGSEDNTAKLWDLQSAEELQRWQHEDEVQLVALSNNGKLAFTMSKYDKAVIWDTESGDSMGTIPLQKTALARGSVFTAVAFSEDDEYLLTGNSDRLVQLWSLTSTGAGLKISEVRRWIVPKRDALRPTSASILDVAFGVSGEFLAIASDGFAHQFSR